MSSYKNQEELIKWHLKLQGILQKFIGFIYNFTVYYIIAMKFGTNPLVSQYEISTCITFKGLEFPEEKGKIGKHTLKCLKLNGGTGQ